MTSKQSVEREVSERFRVTAPTLVSSLGSAPPFAFSRLTCAEPGHGFTKMARVEDAYTVHIMLRPAPKMQLWLNGREVAMPSLPSGGIILSHLENEPIANYESPFDFVRLYIAKATLDELSDAPFGKRPDGLRRPDHGASDPILFSLALVGAELIGRQSSGDQMLLDQLALAFHAHLVNRFSGSPRDARPATPGSLAPWQLKRAKAYFEANLAGNVSIVELARICGLSPSHFARSFRASTGRPPHRWLLERRVGMAMHALKTSDRPLGEIAQICGFSDSSHFSRVFSKAVGEAPAAWRRGHGRRQYSL